MLSDTLEKLFYRSDLFWRNECRGSRAHLTDSAILDPESILSGSKCPQHYLSVINLSVVSLRHDSSFLMPQSQTASSFTSRSFLIHYISQHLLQEIPSYPRMHLRSKALQQLSLINLSKAYSSQFVMHQFLLLVSEVWYSESRLSRGQFLWWVQWCSQMLH